MRRPKWIGVLLLTLCVAAIFALLAQWQLSHAITVDPDAVTDTETPAPLASLDRTDRPISDREAGRVVATEGEFVAGDFATVHERSNHGSTGVWIVGHFAVADAARPSAKNPRDYAVAIGWTAKAGAARSVIAVLERELAGRPMSLEGRFTPTEAPKIPRPDEDPHRLTSMVPGQLVNGWDEVPGPVSAGYLVSHNINPGVLSAAGLEKIESVPPREAEKINWLNLFYAIEWVVFAGFAVYFWTRLARDAWEREHEYKLQTTAAAAPAQAPSTPTPKEREC